MSARRTWSGLPWMTRSTLARRASKSGATMSRPGEAAAGFAVVVTVRTVVAPARRPAAPPAPGRPRVGTGWAPGRRTVVDVGPAASSPPTAGSGALVAAVMVRPRLWATALRQVGRLARPGWWRRPPFLPLPDADYLGFRLETQYGGEATPADPHDLVRYLEWCRDQERLRHHG